GTDIENLTVGFGRKGRCDYRLHAVIDVHKIAQDAAVTKNLNRLVVHGQSNEPVTDPEARVPHLRTRPVDVAEPEQHRPDFMNVVVDLHDFFGGQVRDFVDALRIGRSFFVYGQRDRLAILSARAGVDENRFRIELAAGLHEYGSAGDVDLDVRKRVGQAHDVT